jgi:uncharacterized protein YqeY
MIADTITQKIGEAMKAHDGVRLSTLKMLASALNYDFIAKQHKLSDEEELVVVRREVKKRREAIEIYKKAGDRDRDRAERKIEQEEKELAILQEYLPEEMPEEELVKLVDAAISETGAKDIKDMGKVIGLVKQKSQGRAEGAKIAEIVRNKLT